MKAMLDGTQEASLKRAVFLVENAYLDNKLDYQYFCKAIERYKKLVLAVAETRPLRGYSYADSTTENKNAALFRVFTDSIRDKKGHILSSPFRYNFEDALGITEHSDVFVSTLMNSGKGNCRSLPYLYKILADELGTQAYLALAPMHMYIKQRNKRAGWYNVELTSGQYPLDAYLISDGFISPTNITTGLYMDTLGTRASIALCLADLCRAYLLRADKEADAEFLLNCTEKALEVKPNLVDALLWKQRLCRVQWAKYQQEHKNELALASKKQYDEVNRELIRMDYRDVPQELFEKWYNSYLENKAAYDNSTINTTFKTSKP